MVKCLKRRALGSVLSCVSVKSHTEEFYGPKYFKMEFRAGELAKQIKALVTLAENLGSIPSNHVAAHNHL